LNNTIIIKEFLFKAVRSSGAGGQHVNKVSSKVELFFNVLQSFGLSENEKKTLNKKLKLTKEGGLIIQCSETRSQHKNKEIAIERCIKLLKKSLIVQKRRIKTNIPNKVHRIRLDQKKKYGSKKANRQKPSIE
jgi:ribosome-associated protein